MHDEVLVDENTMYWGNMNISEKFKGKINWKKYD